MADGLHVDRRDGITTATLDRGEKNLLTEDICRSLTQILLGPGDPPTHILHIRAVGEAFCLGRERAAEDPVALRREVGALVGLNQALISSRIISIAEVQGDAAGFGVGLASLCDVTVAATSAEFWFPEVDIDLAPTVVLSWLPALIGEKHAFHMTATGRHVDADEAARLGLVTRVAPGADLPDTVVDEIGRLQALSPTVHAQIKSFIGETRGLTIDQAYALATERLILGSMARRRD